MDLSRIVSDAILRFKLCEPLKSDVPANWALIVALCTPHFLYAYVWFLPAAWRTTFGASAVGAFAIAVRTLNTLQLIAAAFWLWSSRPSGLCFCPQKVQLGNWVLGVLLLALGQSLVHSAYASAGKHGMNYSSKLERHASLEDEEQGSSKRDLVYKPQYVGSVLTVWAGVVTLGPQLPANAWFVAMFWSLLYAITAVMENTFPS